MRYEVKKQFAVRRNRYPYDVVKTLDNEESAQAFANFLEQAAEPTFSDGETSGRLAERKDIQLKKES